MLIDAYTFISMNKLPQLPCACASLRRAARALSAVYDEAVRPAGLRGTQFTLLQAVGIMGEAGHGQLGQILAMDTTTLSRTLRLIEKEKWIEIAPGSDRRERRIRLTPKGAALLERATPLWNAVQKRMAKKLGTSGWQELFRVMDATTSAALAA